MLKENTIFYHHILYILPAADKTWMDEIILLSMLAIRLAGLHLTHKNNNCYCYNIVQGLSFSDDLNVTRGFFLKVLLFSSFMKMDSHLIKSGCGTMLIRCDRATGYLIRWQIKGTLNVIFYAFAIQFAIRPEMV